MVKLITLITFAIFSSVSHAQADCEQLKQGLSAKFSQVPASRPEIMGREILELLRK